MTSWSLHRRHSSFVVRLSSSRLLLRTSGASWLTAWATKYVLGVVMPLLSLNCRQSNFAIRLSSCHHGHRVVVMPSASRCRFIIAIVSVTLVTLYSCHLRHIAFFVSSTSIFIGPCIVITLSSIKRAFGALVPSCHLLSCFHCETIVARPSWSCHHRKSSYVM